MKVGYKSEADRFNSAGYFYPIFTYSPCQEGHLAWKKIHNKQRVSNWMEEVNKKRFCARKTLYILSLFSNGYVLSRISVPGLNSRLALNNLGH